MSVARRSARATGAGVSRSSQRGHAAQPAWSARALVLHAATALTVLALASAAAAEEPGRVVGAAGDELAGLASDGAAIALRTSAAPTPAAGRQTGSAVELRVVDLRHGRVGGARSVGAEVQALLAAEAGPLVLIDARRRRAERVDAFAPGPPLQTLRLPAGVLAATIDPGAGTLYVVAPPEDGERRRRVAQRPSRASPAGGTDAGAADPAGAKASGLQRLCVYRLRFAEADATPPRCIAFAPNADGFELDPPQLALSAGADALWWLQPSHWQAGCGGGGEDLRLLRLDAATLAIQGDLATSPEAEGSVTLSLPACAADPVPAAGLTGLRVDAVDGGVSFVTRVQGSELAAALWTAVAQPSGVAIGVRCLGVGLGQDGVAGPSAAMAGVGAALLVERDGRTTAIAGPIGAGSDAATWQVAQDGRHAALHQGRALVAFDAAGPIGVATAQGLVLATSERLLWRDGGGALRAAAWDELRAVPPPPAGLDAALLLLSAALRLLGC